MPGIIPRYPPIKFLKVAFSIALKFAGTTPPIARRRTYQVVGCVLVTPWALRDAPRVDSVPDRIVYVVLGISVPKIFHIVILWIVVPVQYERFVRRRFSDEGSRYYSMNPGSFRTVAMN